MFYVIVPIYNIGKKLLEKCLKSIVKNNKHCFCIFINDFSPLWNIEKSCIEKYKKEINFIILNNEKNIGLGPTRNVGLNYIKSNIILSNNDYIMFLDSDDQLVFNSLKKLKRKISFCNNPDILRYMFVFKDERGIYNNYLFPSFINKNGKIIVNTFYEMSWLACYKANWIFKNNLYFLDSRSTHEDIYYSLITSSCTKYISSTNIIAYIYLFKRKGSLTNIWNEKNSTKYDSLNWIKYVSEYLEAAFNFIVKTNNSENIERARWYFQKFDWIFTSEKLNSLDIEEYIEYYNKIINIYKKLNISYFDIDKNRKNTENIKKSKIKFYKIRQCFSYYKQIKFVFLEKIFNKYK